MLISMQDVGRCWRKKKNFKTDLKETEVYGRGIESNFFLAKRIGMKN